MAGDVQNKHGRSSPVVVVSLQIGFQVAKFVIEELSDWEQVGAWRALSACFPRRTTVRRMDEIVEGKQQGLLVCLVAPLQTIYLLAARPDRRGKAGAEGGG